MKINDNIRFPISLTNNGHLSLFFTGIGTAFSKHHYQNNLLIIKGDDHLMIDCGTKTPQALYELGINITDIRNFLITHSHADHIGGMEEVMLVNRYVKRQKPTIIINELFQHLLWDLSLRGGAAFNEEHDGKNLTFGDMWNIRRPKWVQGYPRETFEIDFGTINLKMFRTKHIPENAETWEDAFWSIGLIIDNRIMFTSDTLYDPDLVIEYDKIFNFETIFHDCQFFTGGVHASLEELQQLPSRYKKKMILMHYGDNWQKYERIVANDDFIGLGRQWSFYDF